MDSFDFEHFPDEFVTWRHNTFVGVKVDEVFGMDEKQGTVWLQLARQIFCEQGEHNYRVIGHFPNGAPFVEGYPARISISHTNHLFVVASLPKTPDIPLDTFNLRTALGIDCESLERDQVLKVREKFLSKEEMEMVPEKDVALNIIAWTAKEALYKAAMTPGLELIKDITISKLPGLFDDPMQGSEESLGTATITVPDGQDGVLKVDMKLFSYFSYGCCVTIAFYPKCAKFNK